MGNNNYFITAFGTFGNPNGFRQSYWFTNDRNIANGIKTFDLNTNAIKLFPKSRVYAIRKEYVSGFNMIAYTFYTYAKEQNSDRSGTFIGSSILFTNKIAEEHITINQLNEFHNNLINNNVQNDIITVNHSDKFSVIKPSDFDNTEFHLKAVEDLNFIQSSNKNLVVFCETNPEKLQQFFKKALDLLNVYDAIYFTDSREVAEFVNQKGIFKLIQNVGDKKDFEQEIQNLQEERKRKRESSISEFEKEIQQLDDDKNKTLNDFKGQIEQNEKLHQENERRIRESKNDLENIKQIYNDFSSKIKDLVNQLKSDRKLDEVKQIHNENKRRFIEGISQLKKPSFVTNISKANAKSGLRVEHQYQEYEHNHHRSRSREEIRIDIFKVATFVLLLLLIGTWTYFLFFNAREEYHPVQEQPQEILVQPEPPPTPVRELNPKPNSELNENDYRLVAKKLKYNTKADDVVKIIFDKNPTDIKSNYIGQEDIYAKQIIELNRNCFEEKDGILYFAKDTLRHIPSYKK